MVVSEISHMLKDADGNLVSVNVRANGTTYIGSNGYYYSGLPDNVMSLPDGGRVIDSGFPAWAQFYGWGLGWAGVNVVPNLKSAVKGVSAIVTQTADGKLGFQVTFLMNDGTTSPGPAVAVQTPAV